MDQVELEYDDSYRVPFDIRAGSNILEMYPTQAEKLRTIQQSASNAATDPSFLGRSYEYRRRVYKPAAIIASPIQILWLKSEFCRNENGDLVPIYIPEKLIHTSNELSDDVWKAYWSENKFGLGDSDIEVWKGRTQKMWSSLQEIDVVLDLDSANSGYLDSWKEMCINLGRQISPNLLFMTLHLSIATDRVTAHDPVDTTNKALNSILELPVLKRVRLTFPISILAKFEFQSLEIYRTATKILKHVHLTTDNTYYLPTEGHKRHFRFMNLPKEIQFSILEYTDLVAPGPVTASKMNGYALDSCHHSTNKSIEMTAYDSLRNCWSFPTYLFEVNRHINKMSGQVFFSCNEFIVYVEPQLERAPLPLIWSLTHLPSSPMEYASPKKDWVPEHSKFLLDFPSTWIPRLRSLTWSFRLGPDEHHVLFNTDLEDDWNHTIDFIAQNVQLSGLTVTLVMYKFIYLLSAARQSINRPSRSFRLVTRDEVMLPVRRLQGLRDLFVQLSLDRAKERAEELRLERLVMGSGFKHRTKPHPQSGSKCRVWPKESKISLIKGNN